MKIDFRKRLISRNPSPLLIKEALSYQEKTTSKYKIVVLNGVYTYSPTTNLNPIRGTFSMTTFLSIDRYFLIREINTSRLRPRK